jgi:hypothetical protein
MDEIVGKNITDLSKNSLVILTICLNGLEILACCHKQSHLSVLI